MSLTFLLLISLGALAILAISIFTDQKELKVIFTCIFIISNVFLFSSLLNLILSASEKYSFFKSLFYCLIILTGSIAVVFILVLNYTDDHDFYKNGINKADAGVILGAAVWGGNRPSPVLQERINKGYEIYSKGIVQKLVITGGGSPNEKTEAEVSKEVLIKYGVDPVNLISENTSNSTIEQIHFVRDIYKARKWNGIILISDNFHLMRSSEISAFNNINADCISSDKPLSTEGTLNFCLKESLALIVFWMSGL
ncbi:MAG: YdcF family protein [Ignavibacteria bacterium]